MIKFPEKYILTRSKEKDIFTGKKGNIIRKQKFLNHTDILNMLIHKI